MYAQNSIVRLALPDGRSLIRSITTRAWAASLSRAVPLADSEMALPAQFFAAPPSLPPPPVSTGASMGVAPPLPIAPPLPAGDPPVPASPEPDAPPVDAAPPLPVAPPLPADDPPVPAFAPP